MAGLLPPIYCTGVAPPCYMGWPPSDNPYGLPPTFADLLAAVRATLQGAFVDAGLAAWAGAGKVPKGVFPPYIRIAGLEEEADYQEDGSGHAPFDDLGTLTVLAVHSTDDACRALSAQVSAALTDPAYALSEGDFLMLRRTNRGAPVEDWDPDVKGGLVWTSHLTFASIVSKNL